MKTLIELLEFFGLFLAAPLVAYLVVKFGRYGYLRANELFDEKHNSDHK